MAVVEVQAASWCRSPATWDGPAVHARQPAEGAEAHVDHIESPLPEGVARVEHVGAHEFRSVGEAGPSGEVSGRWPPPLTRNRAR